MTCDAAAIPEAASTSPTAPIARMAFFDVDEFIVITARQAVEKRPARILES
jgi:hypothetical protein